MLVAVTGGSGFIGRQLVRSLISRGDRVRVLTRKKTFPITGVEIVVGDLLGPGTNLSAFVNNVDVLYHCAGELYDISIMQALHVNGTQSLIHAAEGNVRHWVQLSSVGAYGHCRSGRISENSSESPLNEYELTKTKADSIVRCSNLSYSILRPSIVFGDSMTNQSLFQMVKMIRKGVFFYIGAPGAIVNYVHIDDVVASLIECGTKPGACGNTYNLSQSITIEEMVEAIGEGLVARCNFLRLPQSLVRMIVWLMQAVPRFPLTKSRVDALTGHCVYDSSRIEGQLGFRFQNSLRQRLFDFSSNVE